MIAVAHLIGGENKKVVMIHACKLYPLLFHKEDACLSNVLFKVKGTFLHLIRSSSDTLLLNKKQMVVLLLTSISAKIHCLLTTLQTFKPKHNLHPSHKSYDTQKGITKSSIIKIQPLAFKSAWISHRNTFFKQSSWAFHPHQTQRKIPRP